MAYDGTPPRNAQEMEKKDHLGLKVEHTECQLPPIRHLQRSHLHFATLQCLLSLKNEGTNACFTALHRTQIKTIP